MTANTAQSADLEVSSRFKQFKHLFNMFKFMANTTQSVDLDVSSRFKQFKHLFKMSKTTGIAETCTLRCVAHISLTHGTYRTNWCCSPELAQAAAARGALCHAGCAGVPAWRSVGVGGLVPSATPPRRAGSAVGGSVGTRIARLLRAACRSQRWRAESLVPGREGQAACSSSRRY